MKRAGAAPTGAGSLSCPEDQEPWELRLYVTGRSPRSLAVSQSLERICEEHLHGRFHIEVIDLLQSPQRARTDQIVAVPTVVRTSPLPIRKLVGNLTDTVRTLAALDLSPAS